MSKWKCDICKKEFDNFHAQGFDNKIYCPLCFFKEDNRRLQNRIDKAIEYIENDKYEYTPMGITNKPINKDLLEILKGGNND